MRLIDLHSAPPDVHRQCAELLVDGFRNQAPEAWPTLEAALAEVNEAVDPNRRGLVLVDDGGWVVGWVGAIPHYEGHVWEIHPLVIRPDDQGSGHGRRLLVAIERLAAVAGVDTLWLGSDDEVGATTLSGRDLYEDPYEAMRTIRNLARHPYEFYQRCGFTIVGVLPDANGPGRPDILLAKRVDKGETT